MENKNLLDIDQKRKDPVKEESSLEEKIKNFFNKFAFLELSDDEKKEVALKITKDANFDILYWWEIFLSASIATLGLLQNSVAVIIGAMLIAPLLRPINGLSFSISTGGGKFFKKSFFVLVGSIFFAVLCGYVITKILSLDFQTPEILARTNPTILDLFVASLSAIVAVLSLKFTRLAESIAGVAMAASLMPPLAVVGIELAFGNFSASWGAFMLFLTNLFAIILVGIIFFWMYGYNPHRIQQHKKVFKRLLFVIIGLGIIIIPLVHSLQLIKEKNKFKKIIYTTVEKVLSQQISNFKIQTVNIKSINDRKIDVDLVLSLPENVNFYKTFKNELTYGLTRATGKNVDLNIELIRMANILSKKTNDLTPKIEQQISQVFTKFKDVQLINYNIQKIKNNEFIVKLVVATNRSDLDKIKKNIEKEISNNLKIKLSFIWIVVPKYQVPVKKKNSKEKEIYSRLSYKWEAFLNQIFTNGVYFKNLNLNFDLSGNKVKNLNTSFDLYIPNSFSSGQLELLYNQIKKFNESISGSKVEIKQFKYQIKTF